MLLLIGSYRLTEFTMGSMANPFYIDHGYTLGQIATIVKAFGLPVSMLGVVIGGFIVAKSGLRLALFLGSGLIIASNLGFAVLATTDTATLVGLAIVNSLDNLAQGIHGTALIAFLSGLTSARYTATQYALFSSFYALPGKLLEGTSGFVVDAIGLPGFLHVYGGAQHSRPPDPPLADAQAPGRRARYAQHGRGRRKPRWPMSC